MKFSPNCPRTHVSPIRHKYYTIEAETKWEKGGCLDPCFHCNQKLKVEEYIVKIPLGGILQNIYVINDLKKNNSIIKDAKLLINHTEQIFHFETPEMNAAIANTGTGIWKYIIGINNYGINTTTCAVVEFLFTSSVPCKFHVILDFLIAYQGDEC